jgi:hypothetical protein
MSFIPLLYRASAEPVSLSRDKAILADVLIAAAGAAALVKERPSLRQGADTDTVVAEVGTAPRDLVQDTARAAVGAISEAAKTILPSSLTGSDDAPDASQAADVKPKPTRRRRNGD